MNTASNLITRFENYLIDPLIVVLFSAGFLFFMLGFVEFLWNLNKGAKPDEGKNHMVWGVVGMLIMVSVYGIIQFIDNSFGFGATAPSPSGEQTQFFNQ